MDTYKNIYSIRNHHLKQCNARKKKEIEYKKVQYIVVWRVQELAGRHSVTGVGEGIRFSGSLCFVVPLCPPARQLLSLSIICYWLLFIYITNAFSKKDLVSSKMVLYKGAV